MSRLRTTISLVSVCVVTLLITACGEQDGQVGKAPTMPRFEDPTLQRGRSVWMGTCRNCHLLGVEGAPAVSNYAAWEPRIAKGLPKLYKSALGGVRGADGAIRMPPRGGNERLSEEQVKMAVQYMVASVRHLNGATR